MPDASSELTASRCGCGWFGSSSTEPIFNDSLKVKESEMSDDKSDTRTILSGVVEGEPRKRS